jgi:hypothetical protein
MKRVLVTPVGKPARDPALDGLAVHAEASATPSTPRPLDRTPARSRSLGMWTPARTTWHRVTLQQLPQEIQYGCCRVPARGGG